MKMICMVLCLAAMLCGCRSEKVMETVADEMDLPAMSTQREIHVDLPPESAAAAMENPGVGKLYLCDGYTVSLQQLPGGSLDGSLLQLTGFDSRQLNPVESAMGDFLRYDFVSTAAGEAGQEIIRGVLVDDGENHYVLTLTANADAVKDLEQDWNRIIDSYCIL